MEEDLGTKETFVTNVNLEGLEGKHDTQTQNQENK